MSFSQPMYSKKKINKASSFPFAEVKKDELKVNDNIFNIGKPTQDPAEMMNESPAFGVSSNSQPVSEKHKPLLVIKSPLLDLDTSIMKPVAKIASLSEQSSSLFKPNGIQEFKDIVKPKETEAIIPKSLFTITPS